MKTEYTENGGFLQRDSVEHKEYAEAYSANSREVEEKDGADLRTVSKRLGHSNMTTTSNIYTHAIQSADERATELLGDILQPIKRA